jgi:hypothetical protein
MKKLITDINDKKIHHGEYVLKVRDLFSRKQESLAKQDDKFFSKYWQVFAWSAIIGFVNDKREKGAKLDHQTIDFSAISHGSETITNGLILMAIGKIEDAKNSDDILNSRKILNIIGEYAEGGAKHILEIKQTPGYESKFNYIDDYFLEIVERKSVKLKK